MAAIQQGVIRYRGLRAWWASAAMVTTGPWRGRLPPARSVAFEEALVTAQESDASVAPASWTRDARASFQGKLALPCHFSEEPTSLLFLDRKKNGRLVRQFVGAVALSSVTPDLFQLVLTASLNLWPRNRM